MIPPWEIWHITLEFQLKIFQFCAYFWLKFGWNFIQKTLLWNKTHNTSILNKSFSILCWFLAKISMKFHSKDTSLRNMTCNSSIQNHNFMNFCLFSVESEYEISLKKTLLRNKTHNTSIPNQTSTIFAYC